MGGATDLHTGNLDSNPALATMWIYPSHERRGLFLEKVWCCRVKHENLVFVKRID